MNTFLIRISIFMAIQLVIAAAVFCNSQNQPRYGYMAAFEDKVRMLQEHREPSMILIGGSNVAFGIDSEILENEIQLPTLNAGLHAGLGLQFYLDVAEKYARRGDIVVLLPEYALFSRSYYPSKTYANELIRQSPEGCKHMLTLPEFDLKGFVDDRAFSEIAFQMQAGMKRHGAAQEAKVRKNALEPGVYSRLNFNQHGDFVGHHGLPQVEVIPHLDGQYYFDNEKYARSTAAINECAATLNAKGAKMFFAYQPVARPVYERSEPVIDKVHEFLKANLSIPILHEPQKVVYDVSCFFDTPAHLNESTKRERTKVLVATLQRQFAVAANREKLAALR